MHCQPIPRSIPESVFENAYSAVVFPDADWQFSEIGLAISKALCAPRIGPKVLKLRVNAESAHCLRNRKPDFRKLPIRIRKCPCVIFFEDASVSFRVLIPSQEFIQDMVT